MTKIKVNWVRETEEERERARVSECVGVCEVDVLQGWSQSKEGKTCLQSVCVNVCVCVRFRERVHAVRSGWRSQMEDF